MTGFKLGLKPLPPDDRDFLFSSLRTTVAVAVPEEFGDYHLIRSWGMLGNNQYGDCMPAGQGHAAKLEVAMGGKPVPSLTVANTLADYWAMNNVAAGAPGSQSDQGTDPRVGLKYHQKIGMRLGNVRHKLTAYAALRVGDLSQLDEAIYLFGAAGVGIDCPQSAQEQFLSGYWRVVPGSPIEGGHWVVVVGRWNGYYEVITWGRRIHVAPAFLEEYMSCAFAMLSPEIVGTGGKSPEAFDFATLQADLAAL